MLDLIGFLCYFLTKYLAHHMIKRSSSPEAEAAAAKSPSHRVVFVGLAHSLSHYTRICRKLGLQLDRLASSNVFSLARRHSQRPRISSKPTQPRPHTSKPPSIKSKHSLDA
eukprot:GABV01011677.1.p1 GENE.GABV01011677.1~~GABV01011677.1.p1  ORF type:complete len:120 (-),score=25.38 GABV01011677.1:3-335(-)